MSGDSGGGGGGEVMAEEWARRLEQSLGDVVDFWMKHTVDHVHGGFFNNVDRDGRIYDTTKHVWLQGRQVWMLSRLYNDREEYRRDDILKACQSAVAFLRKHAHAPGGRIYFALAQDGKPVKLQRKIFAECFYVMALSEYSLAIKKSDARVAVECLQEAMDVFSRVQQFAQNPEFVGAVALEGQAPCRQLNVPMIMLNVICELRRSSGQQALLSDVAAQCVASIRLHVHRDKRTVLETVGLHGEFLDTIDGRLLNPGHAIEAGWFLLDYANTHVPPDADDIAALAVEMIEWSFTSGWDAKHGGLFYFLDALGYSPTQLEWPMKLWWVHNEAMIGALMAFRHTGNDKWWRTFTKVATWTMEHFPDTESNQLSVESLLLVTPAARKRPSMPSGAWFGYLARDGSVNQSFIGAPYKGFFHTPRCLHLCSQLLRDSGTG